MNNLYLNKCSIANTIERMSSFQRDMLLQSVLRVGRTADGGTLYEVVLNVEGNYVLRCGNYKARSLDYIKELLVNYPPMVKVNLDNIKKIRAVLG